MSTNVSMGEDHTPSKSLDNTGIIVYRNNRSNNPEILVRWKPEDECPTYSIPNRTPYLGETAVECARRVAWKSLDIDVPEDRLDYGLSAVVENPGESVKIRVFLVEATRDFERLAAAGPWRGWEYNFIPLSRLERVYLHPDVGASRASLRELLKSLK